MWLYLGAIVLIILIFLYFFYSDLFAPIIVQMGALPLTGANNSLTVMYKFHTGSYFNASKAFGEFIKIVGDKAVFLGFYYDDPQVTPSEQLRWAVAVVTKVGDRQELTSSIVLQLEKRGFKEHNIRAMRRCAYAQCCDATWISPYILPMRVFSAIGHYLDKHRMSMKKTVAIEVYHEKSITYAMALDEDHTQDYYVSEIQ